jgi:hypothetical protein
MATSSHGVRRFIAAFAVDLTWLNRVEERLNTIKRIFSAVEGKR